MIHQVYELWFKQILYELDSFRTIVDRDHVHIEEQAWLDAQHSGGGDEIVRALRDKVSPERRFKDCLPLLFVDEVRLQRDGGRCRGAHAGSADYAPHVCPNALAGADEDGDDQPHRQCAYFGENISCNNDFTCMAMHSDGNTVAVGEYGPRAAVYIFNVYTMEVQAKLTSIPPEGVAAVSFSADGKLLATVALDGYATLSVFEWETQQLVARERVLKLRSVGIKQKVFAM